MAVRPRTQGSLADERRPSGPQRPAEKFAHRRDEIVDLAARLFAANGYSGTGIRDIGEAAGLARGALYYYIDSKESLLGEIHDRVMDPLLAAAHRISEQDDTVADRIRAVSRVLLEQVIGRHDHVWVFLHEYRSLTGDRRREFRRKRREFEDVLCGLFSAGVADGEFVITDIRLTMLAFLGMHNYTYQWVRPGQDSVEPDALATLYCDVFLYGISTRRPRRPAQRATGRARAR